MRVQSTVDHAQVVTIGTQKKMTTQTYTYANIHDDCGMKDEVARGLDTYATISQPAIVPKGKRNPLGIGEGSLIGK